MQLFSSWSRWQTQAMTALFGWIPLLPGLGIRYLLYPIIFKKMGRSVKIYPDVRLKDGWRIKVGFGVVFHRGVEIDIDRNNYLEIGDRVNLSRDVGISCTGQNNKIMLADLVSLDRGVDLRTFEGSQLYIGDRTYVGPHTCIWGYGKISIGKDCLIASHSSLYAHNYRFEDTTQNIREQGFDFKGIVIEDDCWLGSGVNIVDGVTIGRGSVIGAGAVVTKNIPPYSVAVGVPAKVIKSRKN
ncbi:acyltransferase [Myxosarcina sp. GI1]|uniref:acyltransferase n=1 Tax=Myxosarcina sp. GI1 TaxID=1541065 RepID=UPI000566965F|nr:acyltransferase [Myxosarcina sp. GI1]